MVYIKKTDQNKPWALRTADVKRTAKDLSVRNIFMIFCEGENTEPEYFKSFPINTETKVEAIGLGRSKTALIQEVVERLESKELLAGQKNHDEDRQIWCIFDYDTKGQPNEAEDFNRAVEIAQQNQLKVAYSNDAFELWFILHFQYIDVAITRNEFYKILSDHFGWNYEREGKTKEMSQSLYGVLLDRMDTGIANAQRLVQSHDAVENHANKNPITLVHELVIELNKCLKK